jgi:elongation factor Ts
MTTITADLVKQLRERTGVGMMECKKALAESAGDLEKAVDALRKSGAAKAEKRAGREAREGLVEAYIHPGNRVGVLIEVNCETDFVARTPEFQELVRNLAMQAAAAGAEFVRREEVPAERVEREREIFRAQLEGQGKPAAILDKIVDGKLSNEPIPSRCDLCHTFPSVGPRAPNVMLGPPPTSHQDRLWVFNHKTEAGSADITNTQCSACHSQTFCTNCHSTGAVKVKHDNMLFDHASVVRDTGVQACAYCHQRPFCERCHVNDELSAKGELP